MQVYACVYTDNGDFLLATKRVRGYFFSTDTGGVIVPDGELLNPKKKNSIREALPGGQMAENEAIDVGALREWTEETNCPLQTTATATKEWGQFAAGYFLQPPGRLQPLLTSTIAPALDDGNAAATDIEKKVITQYSQIRQSFANAPTDNELASMSIWNIPTDWVRISGWQGRSDVGWFYTILEYLKTDILHL